MREFVISDGVYQKYNGTDEEVKIPEGLNIIGAEAFRNNRYIKKVIVPPGIKILKSACFMDCESLEEVVLPSSLKEIDDQVFANCRNLKKIILPKHLTVIGKQAFEMCRSLEKIDIPDSVISIGKYAFSLQESFWGDADPGLNPEEGLKEVILPKSLREIPSYAFESQTNLLKVIWPDQLEIIRFNAFHKCRNLQIDSFPETLQRIEKNALQNCQISPKAVLPLKYIGDCNLYDWAQGEEVIVPEGVHSIEKRSFDNHPALKKIDLSAVSNIEELAFRRCKNLETVLFSDKLQAIRNGAFMDCESLQSITLPDSMEPEGVGANVFSGCKSLGFIKLPNGLHTLKEGTFFDCTSLKQISIPASIRTIGAKAAVGDYYIPHRGVFERCSALYKVHFETASAEYQPPFSLQTDTFRDCKALTEIKLPQDCTRLGDYCFIGCSNLENVEMPATVKYIGVQCFKNAASLRSVELPESLEVLGHCAFEGCSELKSVTVPKTTKEIGCSVFANSPALKLVRYESQSLKEEAFTDSNTDLSLMAPNVRISAIKTAEIKRLLCNGYAAMKEEGTIIPGEVEAEYTKYLKARRKALLPELPDRLPLLRQMVQQKLLTKDQITSLLKNEKISSNPELLELIHNFCSIGTNSVTKKETIDSEQLRGQLFSAVEKKDRKALEQIISQYELPIDSSQLIRSKNLYNEQTLLECAVEQEDLSILNLILQYIPVENKESGLILAIEKQWVKGVETILSGKVNPGKAARVPQNRYTKKSPLESAISAGDDEILHMIFSKKFSISESVLGKCFTLAAYNNRVDLIWRLLERTKKIKDETFSLLLESLIISGDHHSIDRTLNLKENKVLPHSLAMAYALRSGDANTVRTLVKKKAKLHSARDYSGMECKTLFEKRRYNRNGIFDDDYKAIFNYGENYLQRCSSGYAVDEMFPTKNNYFVDLYKDIPLMSETVMAYFLCQLGEEGICSKQDMEYFWFLSVLGDYIQVAKKLEEHGWLSLDFTTLKKKAMIPWKLDSWADFFVPGVSVEKGKYILDHMGKDEKLKWRDSFFTGREHDLKLFLRLTQEYDKELFIVPNPKHVMDECIKSGYLEGVQKLSDFGAINSQNIKGFLELAENQENVEIQLWLLNYQNENFQGSTGRFSL